MARSNDNDCAEVYFQQGGCRIILKQGDLFDETDVDVIVIPTPENGQEVSHTYPLFEALCSRSDQRLKGQIKKVSSQIKRGGEPQIILDFKPSILLTPTPYRGNEKVASQMLRNTYSACLNFAIGQKYRTIAFPTIGCGESGFKTRDVVNNLYKALAQFEQPRDKQINEIRIIIYNKHIYDEFTSIFMELGQEKNAKIKFREISSKKSNPTEMSSRKDDRRVPQRHSQEEDTQDYPDDFDDASPKHGDPVRRQTSNLNPESPEYRPKNNNQRRGLRRYRINNNHTELHILQGDILETKVDAIVNAANDLMLGGGGVDGVIHRAAGSELLRACKAHKKIYRDIRLPTGRSRILLSYNMSRTTYYIINTSGPRYDDAPPKKCREDLTSCYKTSLALANLYDLETIGFTAISCGIFGYPIDEGAEVALDTVNSNAGLMKKILFVLKDDDIYDAWVKKADQLQFVSLDDSGSVATGTSKQPTDNTRKITEKSNENDESNVSKQLSKMKVTDMSIHDTTRKITEKSNENDESNVSKQSPKEKVIDRSTSDSARKSDESDREKSPDRSPTNPDEKSDRPRTMGKKENDSAQGGDGNTDEKKSGKKKNNSDEKEKTPDNASKQKQTQNDDQSPSSPRIHKDTSQPLIATDHGKKKKK